MNLNAKSQANSQNILTVHTEVIIDDIIFFRNVAVLMKEATLMCSLFRLCP